MRMMEGKEVVVQSIAKTIQTKKGVKVSLQLLQQLLLFLRLHGAVWCGASENSPHKRTLQTHRKNNTQNKCLQAHPSRSHLTLRVALFFFISAVPFFKCFGLSLFLHT